MSTIEDTFLATIADDYSSDENFSVDKTNTTSVSRCYPSLVDLPTELLHRIIDELPESPYHAWLNVSRQLAAIENNYIPIRSEMCICRLHLNSPPFPSQQLKLLICSNMNFTHLETFVELVKRRSTTCRTKIIGIEPCLHRFKNFLRGRKHDDQLNVKMFLKNCEYEMIHSKTNKTFDLDKNQLNKSKIQFDSDYLRIILGQNKYFIQQFCSIWLGSCARQVGIKSTTMNFNMLKHGFQNHGHILDYFDFQRKVKRIFLRVIPFVHIQIDILSGFDYLEQLNIYFDFQLSEHVETRIIELIQSLKQINLNRLISFSWSENSSISYTQHFILALKDLFCTIPPNNLKTLCIESEIDQDQLIRQFEPSNTVSLVHSLIHFKQLEIVHIKHLGFDTTLIEILPYFTQLRYLNLSINIDMSNKNEIDKLCSSLEKCDRLQLLRIGIPIKATALFAAIFVSLAKSSCLQQLEIDLDRFELPADVFFQKLTKIKTLRALRITVKLKRFEWNDLEMELFEKLKRKLIKSVSKGCQVEV